MARWRLFLTNNLLWVIWKLSESLTDKSSHLHTESLFPLQGDGARTSITLDFGDGHALTYSNVSSIEDGIKHIYKAVGIYRVTATGENNLGSETALLYLHVTCERISTFVQLVFTDVVSQIKFPPVLLSASTSVCFPLFFFFLSHSVELLLSPCTQCTTFCALSLQGTCSLPITKQTSEIEQIPVHFHSSRRMLHRCPACWSLICNGGWPPQCIQAVTDVLELTYWSGSSYPHQSVNPMCQADGATAGSGVPRMRNNTQMAANGPSAGENPEQSAPNPIVSACIPTYMFFFSSFAAIKLLFSLLRRSALSSLGDVFVCLSRSAGAYPSLSSLCGREE